jgi:hypothetical protein
MSTKEITVEKKECSDIINQIDLVEEIKIHIEKEPTPANANFIKQCRDLKDKLESQQNTLQCKRMVTAF